MHAPNHRWEQRNVALSTRTYFNWCLGLSGVGKSKHIHASGLARKAQAFIYNLGIDILHEGRKQKKHVKTSLRACLLNFPTPKTKQIRLNRCGSSVACATIISASNILNNDARNADNLNASRFEFESKLLQGHRAPVGIITLRNR